MKAQELKEILAIAHDLNWRRNDMPGPPDRLTAKSPSKKLIAFPSFHYLGMHGWSVKLTFGYENNPRANSITIEDIPADDLWWVAYMKKRFDAWNNDEMEDLVPTYTEVQEEKKKNERS
jgi:hypothetical protein